MINPALGKGVLTTFLTGGRIFCRKAKQGTGSLSTKVDKEPGSVYAKEVFMAKKVIAYTANGMEEVECLAVVDVLRRAGIEVVMTSITDDIRVTGSHKITIEADALIKDVDPSQADMLFLPGGMPGTTNLGACEQVTEALKQAAADGRRVAAICAAPSVLGDLHILEGKKATCYPGFEPRLSGAEYVHDGVVTDGNITTARGMGYAVALGLELVKVLISEEKALEIKASIQRD